MQDSAGRAIAIVGVGAILPDAPDAQEFWQNILHRRYSIRDVPADRWSAADYYDPDPGAPDKTYSKVGGWVRDFTFDWKRFRVPPKVAEHMDPGQQWAVTIAAEALADYGYPERPLDTERTGVILGTAMGGELHYRTHQRIVFPEYARALEQVDAFESLAPDIQGRILTRWHDIIDESMPPITEDSMPGELANIVSGRVANVLGLRGPNFITDAACAASLAAVSAAIELLVEHRADAVITGGVDRNMGVSTFVKFCKIGALSPTGSRPFGEGADGFVMGEGAAAFVLKRLEDAERDGDRIYAVIRGIGASSDGKGKGITAPNPVGQQLAIKRAWENAALDPATATLVEAHGTSTRVGDGVEVESLARVFGGSPPNRIALGSVKSNIGHLKAGAGAAGLLKATLAVYHKVLPPTLNAERPNPNIDFEHTPFYLNHEAREWCSADGSNPTSDTPRRCGVSAYGFGGTNFHVVLEEHVPGALTRKSRAYTGVSVSDSAKPSAIPPIRGILALGATTPGALKNKLADVVRRVQSGWTPPVAAPDPADLKAPERLVIDFGDHDELLDRVLKAQKVIGADDPQTWKAFQAQGIFRGSGPRPGKLAFQFPGQGSQYVNMGRELANVSPVVADVFNEADQIMALILGTPLTDFIFVDGSDSSALAQAEWNLMQTAITQPAMLTLDIAIYRLLESYGFRPDVVMGHSLGEYAALIVSGVMPFADALEAAAARGGEMSKLQLDDNGAMAAVLAPYEVVVETLKEVDGYVIPANINSYKQCVVGGTSRAVIQAIQCFESKGYKATQLPVSHAFHTRIVAPASEPLRHVLNRMRITPPELPLVANVTGDFYPTDPDAIRDMLQQQVASPVQWVNSLETCYRAGVRTFVECGPKRALKGFADDVFSDRPAVLALLTNHPKTGELPTFNQALCGLYAAGYFDSAESAEAAPETVTGVPIDVVSSSSSGSNSSNGSLRPEPGEIINGMSAGELREMLAEVVQQALAQVSPQVPPQVSPTARQYDRNDPPLGSVVISGAGLGLPGAEKSVMDPDNAMRILRGEQFIDLLPERFRDRMLAKNVTRLVKSEDGSGHFEVIEDPDEVIKLAGRPGYFDLTDEYGVPEKLVEALDITTQLAMAAGLDALREAGIPLVQTFRATTTGKYLPDRWLLPESLRDETGVIFASAFPGGDRLADEFSRFFAYQNRLEQQAMLEDLRRYTKDRDTLRELDRHLADVRDQLAREPYEFDRRFIFRILSMGHSQFAEYIGARGPNTHVNSACASTTQAIALAEDWIRAGRCRRVIVLGADDVTSDHLMEWIGAGFLATGAAATDDRVEEAALPFDRRRHGTIIGMGACALVVESEDAVRERGMRGIAEVLSSETRNSAFHGTRLDVDHIAGVMDDLLTAAERRFGIHRHAIAPHTVFMSHETFTPARGGSASAEVAALRRTFGETASEIIVANTKGFTGHPMGVGIEDVIALKILEYGIVPPVPNYREVDPELGQLNLSRGGRYPVQYAIHLAAGFGSQLSLTLTRRIQGGLDRVDSKPQYQHWLDAVSGWDRAETEVVKRVLRVKADRMPTRSPAPAAWQYGTGPMVRTVGADGTYDEPVVSAPADLPIRMVVPESRPIPVAAQEPLAVFATPPVEPPPRVGRNGKHPAAETAAERAVKTAAERPAAAPKEPEPAANAADHTDSGDFADPVITQVLQVVAQQTGYPQDMLDLDLDLEADLGIDTVKQAETFAAIRAAFHIPRQENLKLREYPTLAHVIGFVRQMRPDLAPGGPVEAEALAVEPVNPPAAEPTAEQSVDPVAEQVLQIVSKQTGYPQDMLDLDLDLEADLGIDTVKQAETFAAIRAAFDIPRQENLKLREYPTLAHVIGFVRQMRPDLAPLTPTPPPREEGKEEEPSFAVQAQGGGLADPTALEDGDRFPGRVPVPVLRPALELCKATSVTLDANSRVVVVPDAGGVGAALVSRLQEYGVQVLPLDASTDAERFDAQLCDWLREGTIQGMYWLPALDVEPTLEELDLDGWHELTRQRVKNLYTAMRTLYESICEPETFLVTATRLGGLFGYGADGASAPLGGAVSGFAKAYKREHSAALVKTVDFELSTEPDSDADPLVIADSLIAETLADPGVVEVGRFEQNRYTITLIEQPAADGKPGLVLDQDTVFVITGAAGGITSAITADLAAASGGTFYLLDLVAAPDAADSRIQRFRSDREALKRQLIDEARTAGKRPTPAEIDKQVMAVERQEAALSAVEAVTAAGGNAHYVRVNLLDGPAVAAVVDEIRQRHGRIDVLVHAAGVEISRSLPDKDPAQFDLVFDVKADGFFNLLHAATGLPIGATVVFSSVAGRFGNSGQTDYSAANDLLCKITSSMRRWRPDTRAIAIDWTAWAGIGMAARGSIPKIMEMAGIDLLPPETGIPTVRRELTAGGFRGEVVVANRLGVLTEEWDETGGLDPDKAARWLADCQPPLLMVGALKAAWLHGGFEIETVLDPKVQPFLYDHQLGGTPLLPGVMGVETFAELANVASPGYAIAGVSNVEFHAPFKFYRMEPQTLHLNVMARPADSGVIVAHMALRSVRPPAKAGMPPQEKVHFTADVYLTREPLDAITVPFVPPPIEAMPITAETLYQVYFHGPAYQVIERAQVGTEEAVGLLASALPPNTEPACTASLIAPRLVELCFQTVGIWEIMSKNTMALPRAIQSVTVYRQPEDTAAGAGAKQLYAVARAVDGGEAFDAQVVDEDGAVYVSVSGYQTVPVAANVTLES